MTNPNLTVVKSKPVKPFQESAKAARKHIKAIDGLLTLGNISDAKKRLKMVDGALKDMEEGK